MTLDTPKKRRSATAGTLPLADGTIDVGDRRALSGVYATGEEVSLPADVWKSKAAAPQPLSRAFRARAGAQLAPSLRMSHRVRGTV